MKKIISIILAVMLFSSSLFVSAFAKVKVPELLFKLFMKSADTICDFYRISDFGDYADEIFDTVAEMFPETIAEEYDSVAYRLIASEAHVQAAVDLKWGYLSDDTLEKCFYKGLRDNCLLGYGSYELARHAHGMGLPSKYYTKGVLVGYKMNSDGVCSLYYAVRFADMTADEFWGAPATGFWQKAAELDFPAKFQYQYVTFVEFEGDYYRLAEETHVFSFRLDESGLADYVSDEFILGYPVGIDHIGGDINGDGDVDNKDVVTIFRYRSGDNLFVNSIMLDTNGDGSLDNKDVVQLFRFCSGENVFISEEPYGAG